MEKYALRSRDKAKLCVYCHVNFKKLSDFEAHHCAYKREAEGDSDVSVISIDEKKDEETNPCDTEKPIKTYGKKRSLVKTEKEYEVKREKTCEENTSEVVKMEKVFKLKIDNGCVCDVCNETFTAKEYLKEHKMACHNIQPFVCKVCLKGFSIKESLLEHNRSHTVREPFVCKICDKLFVKKCNLKIHLQSHTGEKSFKCDLCDKSFHWKGLLASHMTIHSSESNFTCKYCPRTFKRNSHMLSHMRWHTNFKQYTCEICFETFKELTLFQMHACCHEPLFCNVCEMTFIRKSEYDQHSISHAKET